jgi:class 3 adenylate cyclase/CHASE2 domain-containing sensor protein
LCCSGFFVFLRAVTPKPFQRTPALIALSVILGVCLLRLINPDPFERLERSTYDMRVRAAAKSPAPAATNLGFVFIDENSVRAVRDGSVGFKLGLYWPREVYGRLIDELNQQGARAVALDIIFAELRHDHPLVQMADGTNFLESDEVFAQAMRRASNVIIAVTKDTTPPPLFLTNAAALGHIAADEDSDGVLRRAEAFRTYRKWHSAFRQVEAKAELGIDLNDALVETNRIVLRRPLDGDIVVPLDAEGNFDLSDFGGDNLPPGVPRKAKPFTEEKVWHMGIVLAARELNLDLGKADINLAAGRIILPGPGGLTRTIPVDGDGFFYIDWCLPPTDHRLTKEGIELLLKQNYSRLRGETSEITNRWAGKLAVVGSSAEVGNDLTDRGATPLLKNTLLVSKHWNVANSVITGRFVRRSSLGVDLALIVLLGILTAVCMRGIRILWSTALVLALVSVYAAVAVAIYISYRYWIPMVFPLLGAGLVNYIGLLLWRLLFEQAERRRIISVFGTVVSQKIMEELLATKSLSLSGARREITVLFADVRGFTELTDLSQAKAAEFVRVKGLTGAAAEAHFDEQAREILDTVNVYLGVVADTIINQDATLDKFIGDCVMAFWGAPLPTSQHAVACVRAAISAQQAISALNTDRAETNKKREIENRARVSAGLAELPILPLLALGSGISTGMATAGLMGSVAKTKNYTVFGREVNLASRLEGLSGRGRIFVSETTYEHLLRDDPVLAASCVPQTPQKVKGISSAVKVYEVPWQVPSAAVAAPSETDAVTA